jgi:hypothetical protein
MDTTIRLLRLLSQELKRRVDGAPITVLTHSVGHYSHSCCAGPSQGLTFHALLDPTLQRASMT